MNEPVAPLKQQSQSKQSISQSLTKKCALIVVIFAVLQIPLFLIQGIMEERQKYNVDYPLEYNGPGAKQQTIIGPVLTIPYEFRTTTEVKEVQAAPEGETKSALAPVKTTKVTKIQTSYLHYFPEALTVNGTLAPEIRDEGKFKSILYSTALEFKGSFNTGTFAKRKIKPEDVKWQEAFLALGISDLRGIRKETILTWDRAPVKFVPGVNGLKLFDSGQYVLLSGVRENGSYPFSFTVTLNGSRDLNIFPAGKENQISLASSWTEPTFTGGFLPTEKTVNREGFKSRWEVSYFSRNLPQFWTDGDPEIKNSLSQYIVGVTLATPVEFYRTAIRAVKYGSLFIVMTFLTFLIFELITQLRIHEIQYLLVGLALCLFFLLLIAITEWVPFVWAYVFASIPTIAQISWYIRAFSKSKSKHLWIVAAAVLSTLYVYLYILLELENFSLLVGSIGLFVALTVVLYVTRNIDWYGESAGSAKPSTGAASSE